LNDELLILNSQGLFPGPHEPDELFFLRSKAEKKGHFCPTAFEITKKLFHAAPDWVEIRYGHQGLRPWEGAAAWIEEGGRASIQIKNNRFTRLYPLEETVAHEMVHAMRVAFGEPRFEEILAFRTSKNPLRRYFGPLFSRAGESLGFILVMAVSWLCCLGEIIFDVSLGANYLLWSPMAVLGLGLIRLVCSQRIFSLALEELEKAVPGRSLAVALRLTDREIENFAKCSRSEILSFAGKEKEKSLRWRQLYAAFFPFSPLGGRGDL
jgi:hypothetical protein